MANRIKVISIVGAGRSGSTLLEKTLATIDGIISVGELWRIWEARQRNLLCGCGLKIQDCAVWNDILSDFDDNEIEKIIETINFVQPSSKIPLMLFPVLRDKQYSNALDIYLKVLSKLYVSIQSTFNCDVIVDASKNVGHSLLLSLVDELELHTVHLVRDSRGVAYSWQKHREISYSQENENMPILSPAISALTWNARNLSAHLLMNRSASYSFVRYSDFIKDPASCVRGILRNVINKEFCLDFITNDEIVISGETHGIFGNPSLRSKSGKIKLSKDVEWKEKMKLSHKIVVFFLSFILLLFYGKLNRN